VSVSVNVGVSASVIVSVSVSVSVSVCVSASVSVGVGVSVRVSLSVSGSGSALVPIEEHMHPLHHELFLEPLHQRDVFLSELCLGDATPCRMTGVTLHSHVRYKASSYTGLYPQSLSEEHVRPVHHQLFLEPLHHGTYSCQSFVLLADYVPNRSAEESKGRTPVRPLSS